VKNFDLTVAPLIPACTGLILGIAISFSADQYLHLGFYIFWFATFSLFLYFFKTILFKKDNLTFHLTLLFAMFFCGGAIFQINKMLINSLLLELSGHEATLITDDYFYDSGKNLITRVDEISENITTGRYPCKILLNLSSISPAFSRCSVTLFLRKNFLQIGDIVILRQFKILPGSKMDFRQGNLGLIFYTPGKTKLRKFGSNNLSIRQSLNIIKRNLCFKILSRMSELTRSFYGLIFLGYKQSEVPVNLRAPFQTWGISHYLARSGLHLTIFSYFCLLIFMTLPLGLFWRYGIAIIVSLLYYFLTYSSVSFLRAELMFLMGVFSKIFLRRNQQLHFLILTCMLILLFNPYQLFGLDFQLSFALVFSLLLVSKLIEKESSKSS
jgi:ComEC/Rec2-related protein